MVETLIWFAVLFAASGILLLERRCLGQSAIVQPLVLCLLAGHFTGYESIGLWMGISLQLLSMGQGHYADWALAGVLSAMSLLVCHRLDLEVAVGSPSSIALITIAVLAAILARLLERRLAQTDGEVLRSTSPWESDNPTRAFESLVHMRLLRGFLLGGTQAAIGSALAAGAILVLDQHTPSFTWLATLGGMAVPALGTAVALGSLSGYRFIGYASAGMAVTLAAAVMI